LKKKAGTMLMFQHVSARTMCRSPPVLCSPCLFFWEVCTNSQRLFGATALKLSLVMLLLGGILSQGTTAVVSKLVLFNFLRMPHLLTKWWRSFCPT
jgi:hypothetical protein